MRAQQLPDADDQDEAAIPIESIRDGWSVASWSRELAVETPVRPSVRRELREKASAVSPDTPIKLRAGLLLQLLAYADRPSVRGALIKGEEENAGVTYLATLDASGSRGLRTVEVIAEDPRAFRIPVRLLEDLTRYVLAVQEEEAAAEEGTDPADVVVLHSAASNGVPTAEALREFVERGVTAKGIAKLLDRTEGRVHQLLREARRNRPDLDWPEVRKGPKPSDGKSPSANRRKK